MKNKHAIFSGVFVFIIMFLSSYLIPDSENKKIVTIIIAGLSGFIGCTLAIILFKNQKH
jgi:lipopolysaccharide export LptBFGC system permease protein LptF